MMQIAFPHINLRLSDILLNGAGSGDGANCMGSNTAKEGTQALLLLSFNLHKLEPYN